MPATLATDPVLVRFRQALDEMYGSQLDRVVLFGSRARGDAHPDSDYDVAVFVRGMHDRFAEMDRLADLGTNICDETGEFVHAMPYAAATYAERSPLMHEIRKDGLDL
jgi:predicted nucleotidyltransferase